MRDSSDLPPDLHAELQALCAEGDRLSDEGRVEAAIAQYGEAWELLPEPKTEWAAATWILAAIGETCFLGGFKTSAREALEQAMHCPDGIGNPFLHLRLGQVLYDLGERDRAADELVRAYGIEGEEIFAGEDPRYLAFLRKRTGAPEGSETASGAPGVMGLARTLRGWLKI